MVPLRSVTNKGCAGFLDYVQMWSMNHARIISYDGWVYPKNGKARHITCCPSHHVATVVTCPKHAKKIFVLTVVCYGS